jgi:hypothetical protein
MKQRPEHPFGVRYPVLPPPKVRYHFAPRVGGHTYTVNPIPPTTKKYY